MARLKQEVIKARLEFAKSVNWDPVSCSKAWRISRYSAKYFIQVHRPRRKERRRPEYENQRLADLQVMSPNQWCEVWGIPRWEYNGFLKMYRRKYGFIATPEIRAQWEAAYWEKLGC
jgi:hypothetical protein